MNQEERLFSPILFMYNSFDYLQESQVAVIRSYYYSHYHIRHYKQLTPSPKIQYV